MKLFLVANLVIWPALLFGQNTIDYSDSLNRQKCYYPIDSIPKLSEIVEIDDFQDIAYIACWIGQQEDTCGIIYDFCDVEPLYPGAYEALDMFIRETLRYPTNAGICGQGVIYVQFVVNLDGALSDLKVLRGLGDPFDQEVLRMITLMPNWIPGIKDGNPVRCRYVLPVKFEV